ncbi:Hypothetical predicted protein, partial [Paramuricea clavata]
MTYGFNYVFAMTIDDDDVPTTSSGRCTCGKGSCPQCEKPYANRCKPHDCSKCGFLLGGSYVPKKKAVKATVPASTIVFSNETTTIYSVVTTTRNNRCFVVVENGLTICPNGVCKESRSVFINSGQTEAFMYDSVKSVLFGVVKENSNLPHAVQVSAKRFAIFSLPSTSNPIGYTHMSKENPFYSCTSKYCRTVKVKTKQLGLRNICMHIHMLLCCLQNNDEIYNIPRCQSVEDTIEEDAAKEDSVSRQNTKQLYSNFQLPYKVETTTLAKNKELDCKALLGKGGWPDVFEPNEMCCGLCKSELSASRTHPASNGKGILITCLNPFRKISIK